MKKRIAMLLTLCLLCTLSGCGSAGEVIDYDLVFVNDSDTAIVEVVADFVDQTSGSRRADSCPMKRGETFGFEAGEFPVTVLVYDTVVGRVEEGELARIVIPEAPRSGDRWYVTARDGGYGLRLTVGTIWPDGV